MDDNSPLRSEIASRIANIKEETARAIALAKKALEDSQPRLARAMANHRANEIGHRGSGSTLSPDSTQPNSISAISSIASSSTSAADSNTTFEPRSIFDEKSGP
jgi:hypothetical protein